MKFFRHCVKCTCDPKNLGQRNVDVDEKTPYRWLSTVCYNFSSPLSPFLCILYLFSIIFLSILFLLSIFYLRFTLKRCWRENTSQDGNQGEKHNRAQPSKSVKSIISLPTTIISQKKKKNPNFFIKISIPLWSIIV
jgi:hypothetical protein